MRQSQVQLDERYCWLQQCLVQLHRKQSLSPLIMQQLNANVDFATSCVQEAAVCGATKKCVGFDRATERLATLRPFEPRVCVAHGWCLEGLGERARATRAYEEYLAIVESGGSDSDAASERARKFVAQRKRALTSGDC